MHEKEKIVETAVQIELELGENNYDFDLFHWRISHPSVQAKKKKCNRGGGRVAIASNERVLRTSDRKKN